MTEVGDAKFNSTVKTLMSLIEEGKISQMVDNQDLYQCLAAKSYAAIPLLRKGCEGYPGIDDMISLYHEEIKIASDEDCKRELLRLRGLMSKVQERETLDYCLALLEPPDDEEFIIDMKQLLSLPSMAHDYMDEAEAFEDCSTHLNNNLDIEAGPEDEQHLEKLEDLMTQMRSGSPAPGS